MESSSPEEQRLIVHRCLYHGTNHDTLNAHIHATNSFTMLLTSTSFSKHSWFNIKDQTPIFQQLFQLAFHNRLFVEGGFAFNQSSYLRGRGLSSSQYARFRTADMLSTRLKLLAKSQVLKPTAVFLKPNMPTAAFLKPNKPTAVFLKPNLNCHNF